MASKTPAAWSRVARGICSRTLEHLVKAAGENPPAMPPAAPPKADGVSPTVTRTSSRSAMHFHPRRLSRPNQSEPIDAGDRRRESNI